MGRNYFLLIAALQGKEIPATWVRLSEPPFVKTPREFERHLIEKRAIAPPKFTHKLGTWFIDIVGIVVPEEQQQDTSGDGWMFLVRMKQDKTQTTRTDLVRAGRASRIDFDVRTPTLTFLRNKRIALAGLGSVGAPIAIELARSGIGEISLIDFDFVERECCPLAAWKFSVWFAKNCGIEAVYWIELSVHESRDRGISFRVTSF